MFLKSLRGLVIVGVLFIAGCSTPSPNTRIETGGTERTSARLDDSQAVLIMTPKDVTYDGKPYKGTGTAVARRIDASFSRYARLVDVSPDNYQSIGDLTETIAENGYGYIVVPKILRWVSGQEHWSKAPVMARVKIEVLEAATGKEISSTIIEGKNPTATLNPLSWFPSYTDNPEELLQQPLDGYVDSFYQCYVCAYL